VVIELDGPSHFLICEGGGIEYSGTSDAKHRVLRARFPNLFIVTGNLYTDNVNSLDDALEEIEELFQQN